MLQFGRDVFMKKLICSILCLAVCLSLFTACGTPTSNEVTGTVTAISEYNVLSLDVCDEYVWEFGRKVTVFCEQPFDPDIKIGSEVIVMIKSISGNRPYEITAEGVYLHILCAKPVIYLYPEADTLCSVKVNIDGELTCTYPEHGEDGWQNFTARPDGTLAFENGNEYYCLYWEGLGNMDFDFSKGFCVKGEDTADFLAETLGKLGLTAREANEFIIYWLPILKNNEYNLISFQGEAYTNAAELEITPAPDSLLRVFMAARPLDAPVDIEPQEFEPFERVGFTVVEWGGGIVE
jgi:hypothetical protein